MDRRKTSDKILHKYQKYAKRVCAGGNFLVTLTNNRTQLYPSDDEYVAVFQDWIVSILKASQDAETFVYQRRSKTRSFDVTPPPRSPKPIIMGKTSARVQLDAGKMINLEHREYWLWALRHRNIVVCIPEQNFPSNTLSPKCWNPAILTNLGAVLANGAIQLAKRYVSKKKCVCFIFRGNSSNVTVTIFAPQSRLLQLYEQFVLNCQFTHPAFEREFAEIRRENRKR